MRNYDPAKISVAFAKLFRTYPSFQASTDADADETLRVYFEAVEPYQTSDIERAVENFITGNAPGVNPNFAPPAPAVAAECRRVMNLRLDSERRRRPVLALPEPDISEEERARVGEGFKRLAGALKESLAPVEAERDRRSKERGEREVRWLKDRGDLIEVPGTPYPVSSALARQYGVGDPDGDADAA